MQATPDAEPRPHRKYVRSFLFSVRRDSPLSRLHVLTKLTLVLVLSVVIVRFIRTDDPDPLGAFLLLALALLALYLSGTVRWVFRSYLLVVFPALFGMALTWVIFNPDTSGGVLWRIPVYDGHVTLGLSLRLGIFLAFAVGWYVWRKEVFWGLCGGLALAAVVTRLVGNPGITFARFDLFHPLAIIISPTNLVIAMTKALGYGAMIFVSLLLVMTTRDVEMTGAMRQLRIPYVAIFFLSTMLRSLSLALADYTTIRQAQVARGVSLRRKNILQVIADLAYMAVPLTATMIRRSSEVGDAVLIRGFSMQTRNPTEFHEVQPLTWLDGVALGLCALFAILVFGFRLHFTRWVGGL